MKNTKTRNDRANRNQNNREDFDISDEIEIPEVSMENQDGDVWNPNYRHLFDQN